MTIEQTRDFMERIKQHYQEFTIDNPRIEEWHRELRKYAYDDVDKKLDEHLKSEQFGNQIPKLFFLTKYLTPEKDKIKNKGESLLVRCTICGKIVKYTNFQNHIDRCNSVDYLNIQSKRLFDKEIDKDKYRNMSDEDFDKVYNRVLEKILEISKDKDEIDRISNYMIGNNYAR